MTWTIWHVMFGVMVGFGFGCWFAVAASRSPIEQPADDYRHEHGEFRS